MSLQKEFFGIYAIMITERAIAQSNIFLFELNPDISIGVSNTNSIQQHRYHAKGTLTQFLQGVVSSTIILRIKFFMPGIVSQFRQPMIRNKTLTVQYVNRNLKSRLNRFCHELYALGFIINAQPLVDAKTLTQISSVTLNISADASPI